LPETDSETALCPLKRNSFYGTRGANPPVLTGGK
jgi:hypothetical protein